MRNFPRPGGVSIDQLERRLCFAAPQAVIFQSVERVAASDTYYTGQPVHVHGLNSDLDTGVSGVEPKDFPKAEFAWDFDDAGGKYNTLRGFNAAHFYDTAGEYDVRLTVTNKDGQSNTATKKIYVLDNPNKLNTIYVSQNGSDTNNGTTEALAVKTAGKAMTLLTSDDTRILFERSATAYPVTAELDINFGNVEFGAYGGGTTKPKLVRTEKATSIGQIFKLHGNKFISVRGLDLQSSRTALGDSHIEVFNGSYANATLFYDNSVSNVRSMTISAGRSASTGMTVVDNVVPGEGSLWANFVYSDGSGHVMLGNQVSNSLTEHVFRNAADRVLFAGNTVSNLKTSQTGFDPDPDPDKEDYGKSPLNIQSCDYISVYNNRFTGGNVGFGPLGQADGTPAERAHYAVFENNVFSDPRSTNGQMMEINHGTSSVMIRNNVFDVSPSSNLDYALEIEGFEHTEYGVTYDRGTYDVQVLNNTFKLNDNVDYGILIKDDTDEGFSGTGSTNYVLRGNLFTASNALGNDHRAATIEGSSLGIFSDIGGNVFPDLSESISLGGVVRSSTAWNALLDAAPFADDDRFITGITLDDSGADIYTPTSAADGNPRSKSVSIDLYGGARPLTGTWTAGAVQRNVVAPPPVGGVTLTPLADAYTSQMAGGTNYGTNTSLLVRSAGGGGSRRTYLKFDVSSIPASTTGPVLLKLNGRLITSTDAVTVKVYGVSDTTWTESGIKWTGQPALDATLIDSEIVSGTTDAVYTFDLTSYVQQQRANGATTIAIGLASTATTASYASFDAREVPGTGPTLTIPQSAITATDDTFLRDDNSGPYGADTQMLVKKASAGFSRESLVRFNIGALSTSQASVKLRLYGNLNAAGGVGVNVFNTSSAWSETSTNWSTRPAPSGSALGTITVSSVTPTWYEVDLTTFVNQQRTSGATSINLLLQANQSIITAEAAYFNTSEATSNAPELAFT